jgi:hypothetical protein
MPCWRHRRGELLSSATASTVKGNIRGTTPAIMGKGIAGIHAAVTRGRKNVTGST